MTDHPHSTRPLRILVGHLGEPDPNSGAAGTNLAVVKALREAGHQVTDLWQRDVHRRIAHHALYYAMEAPMAIRAAVARELARQTYDIVDFSQPHGYLAAVHVRKCHPNTRYVHFSHGFEGLVEETVRIYSRRFPMQSSPRPIWRRMGSVVIGWKVRCHNAQIAKAAHGHIVSGGACAQYLVREHRVCQDRVAVIPQAATASFLSLPWDRVGRGSGVLYAGQFAWIKAPIVVAAVFRKLAAETSARLCWVCDAQHHDAVRQLLGSEHSRVELRPWMPQDKLANAMAQFSVLLFPSFFEGFGKVFVEAMALGMCVVGTAVGGMRDLITDGVNGRVLAPGDVDGLAQACLDLIADPEKAVAQGARARDFAATLTWSGHAEQRVSFYRRLLADVRP